MKLFFNKLDQSIVVLKLKNPHTFILFTICYYRKWYKSLIIFHRIQFSLPSFKPLNVTQRTNK